jgi:hypothetical protein
MRNYLKLSWKSTTYNRSPLIINDLRKPCWKSTTCVPPAMSSLPFLHAVEDEGLGRRTAFFQSMKPLSPALSRSFVAGRETPNPVAWATNKSASCRETLFLVKLSQNNSKCALLDGCRANLQAFALAHPAANFQRSGAGAPHALTLALIGGNASTKMIRREKGADPDFAHPHTFIPF